MHSVILDSNDFQLYPPHGLRLNSNSQNIIPNDHISHLYVYSFLYRNCTGMQSVVPTTEVQSPFDEVNLAVPKSAILKHPFLTSIFSGLRSLWIMPNSDSFLYPYTSCFIIIATSASLLIFFMYSRRLVQHSSITMQTCLSQWMIYQTLTRLGWLSSLRMLIYLWTAVSYLETFYILLMAQFQY